jgi:hypothetical protein
MRITAVPPPAPAGHKAHVEALNPDGQITSFMQELPVYTYEAGEQGLATLSRYTLAARTEAMLTISAPGGRFTDSSVDIGFGGRDVRVKGIWVVSPSELRANVAVPAGAMTGGANLTVFSGLETLAVPIEIEPGADRPTLSSDLRNADTGSRYVYPGSIAALPASNIGEATDLKLALNGMEARIVSVSETEIRFEVPDLPPGAAVVSVSRGGGQIAAPVFVQIGPRPPEIRGVMEAATQLGNALTLYVAGLGDAAGRIEVVIGGVVHSPVGDVTPESAREGEHRVTVFVSRSVTPGQLVPVTVSIDGRTSAPYVIAVTP